MYNVDPLLFICLVVLIMGGGLLWAIFYPGELGVRNPSDLISYGRSKFTRDRDYSSSSDSEASFGNPLKESTTFKPEPFKPNDDSWLDREISRKQEVEKLEREIGDLEKQNNPTYDGDIDEKRRRIEELNR